MCGASNGKLAAFELWLPDVIGPEAIAMDAQGRLYTGALNGDVWRVDASGHGTKLANTGGRPLGMKALENGALVIAVVNPTSLALLKPPGEWGTGTAGRASR